MAHTIRMLCLVLAALTSPAHSYPLINNCPSFCLCDLYVGNLTIFCTQPQLTSLFVLPPIATHPSMTRAQNLLLSHAYLNSFPLNTCQFSETLLYLDLSSNFINAPVTFSTFNCLRRLQLLNISNNLIQTLNEASFDYLNSLKVLDLRNNRISSLSVDLFYFKLPNLTTLILRNNLIIDLDVWFLFMPNINIVDLSFNQIRRLVNAKGWNPFLTTPYAQPLKTSVVDVRFNKLTAFDDQTLKLYSVCTQETFNIFISLFSRLLLDNNPLSCSCSASYNLLTFFKAYSQNYVLSSLNQLYLARCASEEYAGLSIFSFASPSSCTSSGQLFFGKNCGYQPTTTTTTRQSTTAIISTTSSQTKNVRVSESNSMVEVELLNGTRAEETFSPPELPSFVGSSEQTKSSVWWILVAIAFLGGLVLILSSICCCVHSGGVLALLFSACPIFYKLCPCKSEARRDQVYDVFISFNKSNEKWVRNQLLPYIKSKNHL
jgi:hypothetical protein